MGRLPLRIPVVAALLGGVLLAGCVNPFTPSRPQLPSDNSSFRADYSRPDSTLSTIARAFTARGTDGQQAYFDAIADSTSPSTAEFYAFAAPTVVDAWEAETNLTPPAFWGHALEEHFYGYMSGLDTRAYTYTWDEDRLSSSDPPEDDVNGLALKHRHYALAAHATAGGSAAPLDTIAVGYADLYFQRVNGNWLLYRWEDRIDPAYGLHPANSDNITMGRRRLDSQSGSQ
jgi:hypothetical protein